mgnify:CR=1 FL=1
MRTAGKSVPKYRKHRASGRAIVTLSGKDHYLGPYGTKVSRLEYDRLIAEWLSNGRRSTTIEPDEITVVELIAQFLRWSKQHYRKNGQPTGTTENHKLALSVLKKYYGRKSVSEFGPKSLKAIQGILIKDGLSRRSVNDRIATIKQVFKYGASEELVNPEVYQALSTVSGLAKGRSEARETEPVKPVADTLVDQTVKSLPPVVADMARLQRLTGARPAEICILRPCDIDRSGEIWLYRPESHKTEHHGHARIIAIGERGQAILLKYLVRDAHAYCFDPRDSEAKRRAARHEQRVVPLHYGNRPGSNRTRKPKTKPGDCYTTDSYRRAIHRACENLKIEKWSPNRLRHTAATESRKRFGLEAAQVTLGHSKADVTQIYAEADIQKAIEVAKQVG